MVIGYTWLAKFQISFNLNQYFKVLKSVDHCTSMQSEIPGFAGVQLTLYH